VKIIILTSNTRGMASRVIPVLYTSRNINIIKVVIAKRSSKGLTRFWRRRIKKVFKIGLLGALNGLRLRSFYTEKDIMTIYEICRLYSVPIIETPYLNCFKTRQIFKEADADFGISLGNGYIPKSIFSIPKYGMMNVHMEILPEFQRASSIIWPIYERVRKTGFSIHKISDQIDKGDILYKEVYPIDFYPKLKETVIKNLHWIRINVPRGLLIVCENFEYFYANATPQGRTRYYTTPTFWEYLKMVKNNRIMYKEFSTNYRSHKYGTTKNTN